MRRLLAAAIAAPALLAGPAQAGPPALVQYVENAVQGCYGAVVVVCDPHVSSYPVEFDVIVVPVCAGSCMNVPVPVPGTDGSDLCVAWTDERGRPDDVCVPTYLPMHRT